MRPNARAQARREPRSGERRRTGARGWGSTPDSFALNNYACAAVLCVSQSLHEGEAIGTRIVLSQDIAYDIEPTRRYFSRIITLWSTRARGVEAPD